MMTKTFLAAAFAGVLLCAGSANADEMHGTKPADQLDSSKGALDDTKPDDHPGRAMGQHKDDPDFPGRALGHDKDSAEFPGRALGHEKNDLDQAGDTVGQSKHGADTAHHAHD